MKRYILLSMLFGSSLLAACSTNGQSISPAPQQVDLTQNKLQFAVGTANLQGATDLNTVVTLRQVNGLSAVLVDTPTITGPAGFAVPSVGSAGTDAGTNHISGSAQQLATPPPPPTTFGQHGGVFSYGFAPLNSTTTGAANYPGNPGCSFCLLYFQPFYTSTTAKVEYVGGPPAYPFFNDGTFPAGFEGYAQGFTMFSTAPVGGQYTISVATNPANAAAVTYTASATLSNTTPLGTYASAPAFTSDGAGGGTGTVTIPADSRITETLVYVIDCGPDATLSAVLPPGVSCGTQAAFNALVGSGFAGLPAAFYTVGPIAGTGAQSFTLPDKLGPCISIGCNTNANAKPTIPTGDDYRIIAVSFDYPAFEASPPKNTSQTPTITGAGGQADLTVSPAFSSTY